MKQKLTVILLTLAMLLVLPACSERPSNEKKPDVDLPAQQELEPAPTEQEGSVPPTQSSEAATEAPPSEEMPPPDDGKEGVLVSTPQELLDAVAPGAHIRLAPGIYDMTAFSDETYGNPKWNSYVWMNQEGTLYIQDVDGMLLMADQPGKRTEIQVTVPYIPVMGLQRCSNFCVQGISFGHAVEPGCCTGSVLQLEECQQLTMKECDLYGCGAYSLEIYGGSEISLLNSGIHHCTDGAFYIMSCADFLCEDTAIRECNGDPSLIYSAECDSLLFRNCSFVDNEGELVPNPDIHDNNSYITLENCFLDREYTLTDFVTVVNES